MSFTIPSEIFDVYNEVCDELLNNDYTSRTCKLYFNPTQTECPNCVFDQFTRKSAGVYKAGGPFSFSSGLCPMCNGEGLEQEEVTESIRLRIYQSKKDWTKFTNIVVPESSLMTIGKVIDMPKCQRAIYMRINISQDNYNYEDFVLANQPQLHGFGKNRYFMCFWKYK